MTHFDIDISCHDPYGQEECKQLRELQSKLDVEIQHRKSLEDELDKSKVPLTPPACLTSHAEECAAGSSQCRGL
jgi:hypothetical protein